MTTTHTIKNLPSATTIAVDVYRWDAGTFILQPDSRQVDPKTGVTTLFGKYSYPDPAGARDTEFSIQITYDPRANGGAGKTNYQAKVTTYDVIDTDGVLVARNLVEAWTGFSVVGAGIPPADQMIRLLSGIQQLCYPIGGVGANDLLTTNIVNWSLWNPTLSDD